MVVHLVCAGQKQWLGNSELIEGTLSYVPKVTPAGNDY